MSRVSFVALRSRSIAALSVIAAVFSLVVADADPASAGGISVSADRWDVDTGTGVVSYALSLNVTGAAAAGQPCQSYCTWRIEGWYRDGTVEKLRRTLASGPGDMTNDFTLTRAAAPARLPEITHVRAVLAPNYTGQWTTWTTGWKEVSSPYPDGRVEVVVNSWNASVDTGAVNYDLIMRWSGAGQYNGPCVSYCSWSLNAYFKDGTVEKTQGGPLTSGSLYSAGVWSESFAVKGTIKGEITHLKATLAPYDSGSTNETYTTWVPVHPTYPTGTADVVVRTWSFDPATGKTTYDLTGAWKGAAQVGGPCVNLCRWTLDAFHRDGTTDQQIAALRNETIYAGNTWTTDIGGTGTFTGIATHVRAALEPYDGGSSNERYVRWVPVAVPENGDRISLSVGKWKVDELTGLVDYDVTLTAVGAGGPNGPCAAACSYGIEAWHKDETGSTNRATLYSSECSNGCWAASKRTSAAGASVGSVTHLRAYLKPNPCPEPCGMVESWVAVSRHVHKDQDFAAGAAALAPLLARNPTFSCKRFLLRAGTHHIFRSSLNDQYVACELAAGAAEVAAVKVLESIADAPGPATVLDYLPEPFPRPNPEVPPLREDWEDETGCEQNIPKSSIEAIAWKIELRHGYESTADASRWSEDAPWRDLVWPYAMTYKASQGSRVDRCERVIDYGWVVGYEYVYEASEHRLTTTYTVVTDKDTGNLVTAHPGRPGEDQAW